MATYSDHDAVVLLVQELRVALDLIDDLERGGGYFYENRRSIVARMRLLLNSCDPEMSDLVQDIEGISDGETNPHE